MCRAPLVVVQMNKFALAATYGQAIGGCQHRLSQHRLTGIVAHETVTVYCSDKYVILTRTRCPDSERRLLECLFINELGTRFVPCQQRNIGLGASDGAKGQNSPCIIG